MMTQNADKKREQLQMFSMDDMVPQDHLLRLIDKAIDWTFIYDLVEEKYSPNHGRPSMDPVMLIKIPVIQYLYGIRSMRQTIKDIEVNVAYRWFLGLDMLDSVPHFSTFGKNYTRRFDTELSKMLVPHLFGGMNIRNGHYTIPDNDRARLISKEELAVGDIILADWSGGDVLYVYAGGRATRALL